MPKNKSKAPGAHGARNRRPGDFLEFLRNSPLSDEELDLAREDAAPSGLKAAPRRKEDRSARTSKMRRQAKKSMADGRERRDKRASSWQVQDAKARFSELVDKALTSGPQWVTKHNRPAVVVISVEEFEKLSRTQPSESLADVLARSPYKELELDLTRKRDYGRPVDL